MFGTTRPTERVQPLKTGWNVSFHFTKSAMNVFIKYFRATFG